MKLKNNRAGFKKVLIFFVVIFLSACGSSKTPPKVAVPESEKTKILQSIQQSLEISQALKNVKGYAQVHLKTRKGSTHFDEVVFIRFPDSFYFETVDDFGNARYVLISNGENLSWQDYSKKEYGEEALSSIKLEKILPLRSTLAESLGFLVGKLGVVLKAGDFFQSSDHRYELKTPEYSLIWDTQLQKIVSVDFRDENGKVTYRYEGLNFFSQAPGFPSKIHLRDYKHKTEMEIRYQFLEENPTVDESLFNLKVLPDAKKVNQFY